MPEHYFVDCDCGSQMQVELFEAGTSRTCPACQQTVRIPNTTKLKENSGDKYPLLSPLEKIRKTASALEPPFNGICHGCRTTKAQHAIPCVLNVMEERHVSDDGGIRPSLTGNVSLVVGKSEEQWQATSFPLLLCDQCLNSFQSDQARNKTMRRLKSLALFGLLVAFLYFAYHHAEVVAALAGLAWLIGIIVFAARYQDNKQLDPNTLKWVSKIRWVPEALEAEDEYVLVTGKPHPINDFS